MQSIERVPSPSGQNAIRLAIEQAVKDDHIRPLQKRIRFRIRLAAVSLSRRPNWHRIKTCLQEAERAGHPRARAQSHCHPVSLHRGNKRREASEDTRAVATRQIRRSK
jgi:hypothetical protein